MEFLQSLTIVFLASALAVFVLHKLRLPSIIGFLLSGVLIGPNAFALVHDTHVINLMAEVGVIVLLFVIGIEFSLASLGRIKREVLGGGTLQVGLTVLVVALITYPLVGVAGRAVFLGFLVALSSTAIVMKVLSQRGETDTPAGRMMLGILIFQDLCVVPFMLLLPALAGQETGIASIAWDLLKAALIVALVLVGSRKIVNPMLHHVVRTRSRELFITTIILLCIGTALLTSEFGLSLALGAFLAGLVISESEYAHQALSDVLPFKESFMGLFFVSVGMLLDAHYALAHLGGVLLALFVILVVKGVAAALAALAVGAPLRVALHAGLGLAEVGEFSLVLAMAGMGLGLMQEETYQSFLAAAVLSMALSPFLVDYAPRASAWVASLPAFRRRGGPGDAGDGPYTTTLHDHVIIVGYGINGRNLSRALKAASIEYVVLEMNGSTVREMGAQGEPIHFGDAASLEVLKGLGLLRARVLVLAISDAATTRRVTAIARSVAPAIFIIARTRYLGEVDELKALGADEVIPEEFETSVEIFARALSLYQVPESEIAEMVRAVRNDNYRALRETGQVRRKLREHAALLPDMEVEGLRVEPGSGLIGRSIRNLEIRRRTGATVIAVRRAGDVVPNPQPDFKFEAGDIVLFTGREEQVQRALACMKQGAESCSM